MNSLLLRSNILLIAAVSVVACSQAHVPDSPTLPVIPTTTSKVVVSETPLDQTAFELWSEQALCDVACWGDIIPGKTSAVQAQDLLSANKRISDLQPNIAGGLIRWQIFGTLTSVVASFDIHAQTPVIDSLEFNFQEPFELKEVIDIYGQPSHILALAYESGDGFITYALWIFYQSQGVALTNGGRTRPDFEINSTLKFNRILLFSPENSGLAGATKQPWQWENIETLILPWDGFANYKHYCRLYNIPSANNNCGT